MTTDLLVHLRSRRLRLAFYNRVLFICQMFGARASILYLFRICSKYSYINMFVHVLIYLDIKMYKHIDIRILTTHTKKHITYQRIPQASGKYTVDDWKMVIATFNLHWSKRSVNKYASVYKCQSFFYEIRFCCTNMSQIGVRGRTIGYLFVFPQKQQQPLTTTQRQPQC